MKAKSKSVSLLPQEWEQVERIAAENFRGNRSAYFQVLFKRDLAAREAVEAAAVKRSVSFPEKLLGFAQDRAESEYAGSVSAYIQDLIRRDAREDRI